MNEISKISFNFAAIAIALLVLVAAYSVFMKFYFEPPLFIPPADEEVYLFEQGIQEFKNLEGLKNACTRFARCAEEANAFRDYHFEQMNTLFRYFGTLALIFISTYGWGFWKIYRISKRITKDDENAL